MTPQRKKPNRHRGAGRIVETSESAVNRSDRSRRPLFIGVVVLLTVALIAFPHVSTLLHVMAQAVAMGVAGGFVMVVFFSFWGRTYGRRHLGRIQGVAQALTVLASAIGPLLLAWSSEATGSYAAAFYALAGALALLTVAAVLVRIPSADM